MSSSAVVQKNVAIIHRVGGVDKHSSACDQNDAAGTVLDAADRSFVDGRTQWTPLSAPIDNRAVSSVVEGTLPTLVACYMRK